MTDERDMDPEPWEHEAAPSPDERLPPAFLAALRRTEAGVAALTRMADSLSNRFPRTRAAVATRLLAVGGARRDVEPLLAIADLGDLAALLGGLEDVTPPPWLVEHVLAAYRRCIPHASDGGKVFDAAAQLLAQGLLPAKASDAILNEATASLQRLGADDRAEDLLELAEAIRTGRLPDGPRPLLVRTVATSVLAAAPELARTLLSGIAPADLEDHVAAMLDPAARSGAAWLAGMVAGAITSVNAAAVLEAWLALDETEAENLRAIAERAVGVEHGVQVPDALPQTRTRRRSHAAPRAPPGQPIARTKLATASLVLGHDARSVGLRGPSPPRLPRRPSP